MPTYEYKCAACGHSFEKFQSITSDPIKKCPECGKNKVQRLIGTGAGLIFKGSGFYITDYRDSGYKDKAKADSGAPAEAKGETKSGGETAAATKSDGGKSETPAPAKADPAPAPKSDAPKETKKKPKSDT